MSVAIVCRAFPQPSQEDLELIRKALPRASRQSIGLWEWLDYLKKATPSPTTLDLLSSHSFQLLTDAEFRLLGLSAIQSELLAEVQTIMDRMRLRKYKWYCLQDDSYKTLQTAFSGDYGGSMHISAHNQRIPAPQNLYKDPVLRELDAIIELILQTFIPSVLHPYLRNYRLLVDLAYAGLVGVSDHRLCHGIATYLATVGTLHKFPRDMEAGKRDVVWRRNTTLEIGDLVPTQRFQMVPPGMRIYLGYKSHFVPEKQIDSSIAAAERIFKKAFPKNGENLLTGTEHDGDTKQAFEKWLSEQKMSMIA